MGAFSSTPPKSFDPPTPAGGPVKTVTASTRLAVTCIRTGRGPGELSCARAVLGGCPALTIARDEAFTDEPWHHAIQVVRLDLQCLGNLRDRDPGLLADQLECLVLPGAAAAASARAAWTARRRRTGRAELRSGLARAARAAARLADERGASCLELGDLSLKFLPWRRLRDWDLRMLLRHACESLAAFGEGIEAGRVGLDPAAGDGDLAADPARAFRDRACQLLDAWTGPSHQRQIVDIAGCPLAASVMAAAAALEVAVHGWDISRACGPRQPIPRALATSLLAIAPVLVPGAGGHPLFAAPVAVAATAGPSDRLAAFLSRSPA